MSVFSFLDCIYCSYRNLLPAFGSNDRHTPNHSANHYATPYSLFGWVWLAVKCFRVFYRDLQKVIIPLLQLLWFVCAIFFPIAAVPVQWRMLFTINPVAGLVDQARTFGLYNGALNFQLIALRVIASLLFLCFCLSFFVPPKMVLQMLYRAASQQVV